MVAVAKSFCRWSFEPLPFRVALLSAYTFVFLILSSAHLSNGNIAHLPIELVLIGVLSFYLVPAYLSASPLVLLALVGLLMPLFSSVANHTFLQVTSNAEFRSWAKALLFLPVLPILCRTQKQKRNLVRSVLGATFVFIAIVGYRYLVLHEVRLFDLRPSVHTKNGDPNFICVLIACAVPFLVERLIAFYSSGKRLHLFCSALGLAFMLAGVAMTESRMGYLSLIGGLVTLFFLSREAKHHRWILVSVFAILLAVSTFTDTAERFEQIDDASNHARVRSLMSGIHMTLERPLLGYGWGTSPEHYYRVNGHGRLASERKPLAVHNTFIHFSSELGILGLVSFASIIGFVALSIGRSLKQNGPFGSVCAASLVTLLMNLMTLPLRGKDFVLIYLAVYTALCVPGLSKKGELGI